MPFSRLLRRFAALFLLSLSLRAEARPAVVPLADLLAPDGTLRTDAGFAGTLDARGWTLADGLDGPPRFVRTPGAWAVVGTGPVNQTVNDVVVDRLGYVYIAGTFTQAGNTSTAPLWMVAQWNGEAWQALGGANDWIFALALSPDHQTLYVAGRFTQIGGITASRVAQWSGGTWNPMGPGFNNPPEDLVVDANGLVYAGGGMRLTDNSVAGRGIFVWSGTAWSVPGGGVGVDNQIYGLAVDAQNRVYASGSFRSINGVAARNVARWNGTAWSDLGGGTQTTGAVVYAVEVAPDGSLYAGGFFTEMGGVAVSHLARWNGTAWTNVGGGVSGSTGGGTAVRDLAFDALGRLYVAGSFTEAGGVTVNGIARYDGAAWGGFAGGVGNGTVVAIALHPARDFLYAGGGYSSIGGVSGLNYFAVYEGGIATGADDRPRADAGLTLDAVAPHPVRGAARVRFTLDQPADARLDVVDALGRTVAVLHEGAVAAGQAVEARLDGAALPAGIYVLRLRAGTAQAVQRVTVAR